MKTCSKCKEEKLFSEFSKNRTTRDGYHNQCKICIKYYQEINKENLKNYKITYNKMYYELNYKHLSEYHKQYWNKYYDDNREQIAEQKKQYREANKAKMNNLSAKRRASKLQATPKWLTPENILEIEKFYERAQFLKLQTGQEYHVDHIVPLQGKNVCGLHVPWNLQVIPAKENRVKSNKVL